MARQPSWGWALAGLGVLCTLTVGAGIAGVAVFALTDAGASEPTNGHVDRLVEAYGIRRTLAARIVGVAREVGTHPYYLADLIYFETARKFTSAIVNEESGASGLIQFTETTAERLNTSLEYLRSLSEENQMPWVQLYLEQVAIGAWPDDPRPMPLDTKQRLYMSVFYPEARDWPLNKAFPANVQARNPGIKTVADYMAKVARIGKLSHLVTTPEA